MSDLMEGEKEEIAVSTEPTVSTPLTASAPNNVIAILAQTVGRVVGLTGRSEPRPDLDPLNVRASLTSRTLSRLFSFRSSYIMFVLVPSLISWIYLAIFASDQYASEAKFALQMPKFDIGSSSGDKKSSTSVGGLGAIPAMAGQEAYVVAAYIRSPAIFHDLPPELDPRSIFRRPEADFWARLKSNSSLEDLRDYWQSMVTTYVDGPSGVVTVTIRAFRPADARLLTQAVIAASEKLVNTMTERARRDALGQAEAEVSRTDGLVRVSLKAEHEFRNRKGFLDPIAQANSTSALLLQVMTQKLQLESEYEVSSRSLSPNAPTLTPLKAKLDSLNSQIFKLKSQLTTETPNSKTIAVALAEFENLELDRLFSEKLYNMAQDALERARLKVERQVVYLSVFEPPMDAQSSEYPTRFSFSLVIFTCFTAVWGVFALSAATVADHTY